MDKIVQLAKDFEIAIAMIADEDNITIMSEVEEAESLLSTAVDYGLEAARQRAYENE